MNRVSQAYHRIQQVDRPEIWIELRSEEDVQDDFAKATGPLKGKLLAVKGNIDVHGLPTTAGCPGYAYDPKKDARVVAKLREAGAVVLGTTNMDQFATGLVGTRSPYGPVRNAVDPQRISGGSSSGSAVAVALGIVDIGLGTDTAGSGRVPAALNGIVGLKPSLGAISTDGVVPACRSVDCVSIFTRTVDEAEQALLYAAENPHWSVEKVKPLTLGVPSDLSGLAPGWAEAFAKAAERFEATLVLVDMAPYLEAAKLLYEGAFVAERYDAVGDFIDAHPDEVDPTVRKIISRAKEIPAYQYYRDQRRLEELKATTTLAGIDALLLPTTTSHPTIDEVAADPIDVNASLGRFTNFVNLFGYAALAIPAGTVNGLPFGVSLVSTAQTEAHLIAIAKSTTPTTSIAVVGAHLAGQPLNHQLVNRGATLTQLTTTAPTYRLYALATTPPKPGLVRDPDGGAVEAEVWELPVAAFGDFVSELPTPMAIGKVELADGTWVPGFTCERHALTGAEDITRYGGWRAYLSR